MAIYSDSPFIASIDPKSVFGLWCKAPALYLMGYEPGYISRGYMLKVTPKLIIYSAY